MAAYPKKWRKFGCVSHEKSRNFGCVSHKKLRKFGCVSEKKIKYLASNQQKLRIFDFVSFKN